MANPVPAAPDVTHAAAATPLSKAQAKSALAPASAKKIRPELLERLLETGAKEFIVVFEDETPPYLAESPDQAERLSAQKTAFKATRTRVLRDLADQDLEFRHELDALPIALVHTNHPGTLVKLLNHPGVVGVVENIELKAQDIESLPLIHQPASLPGNYTGTGTAVVVIDRGVNYSLPEFGSCTSPGVPTSCRVVVARSTASNDPYIAANHGSNVAGIVALVAGNTRIVSLDVFNGNETASLSKVLSALDWSINNQTQYNIVAVNMSLGDGTSFTSPCTSALNGSYDVGAAYTDTIRRVRAARIIPVAATGNHGYTNGVSLPACVPGVIAVGATYDARYTATAGYIAYHADKAKTIEVCRDAAAAAPNPNVTGPNRVACFSNGGNLLTMFAPGAYYITAGGVAMGGTSQAAPHVAGAVAVLRGANAFGNETIDQTQARLTNSGLSVTDPRNGQTRPRLDILGSLAGPHYTVAQQLYVAYYGRPADPGGLAFWASALTQGNAPTTITDLNSAYDTNGAVKFAVDSFANSQESRDLYTGTTSDFVTAIYRNVLGRDPEASGLAWWSQQIDNGNLTRGRAAIWIMASAMANSDSVTVNKKTAVATNFTTAIDTADENAKYSGTTAMAKARTMLGQVGSSTDVNAFQANIDYTLYVITYQ